jgi:hypothetical protein
MSDDDRYQGSRNPAADMRNKIHRGPLQEMKGPSDRTLGPAGTHELCGADKVLPTSRPAPPAREIQARPIPGQMTFGKGR